MKTKISRNLIGGVLLTFLAGMASSAAQETPAKETSWINMRYESWKNTGLEDVVIYKIKGEGEEPEIHEIKVVEIKPNQYDFQTRVYLKEQLIGEKRETVSLGDINRYYKTSELKERGVEIKEFRETIMGSVYLCQSLQYPDGSVEVYTDKIPAGGLFKKIDPEGNAIEELLEIRQGLKRRSMVTEMEELRRKPVEIKKGALTVSELMTGLREEDPGARKAVKDRKRIEIGNIGKQPVERSSDAETFLEEVRLQKGKSSDRFSQFAPVLAMGFDRPKASAKFHLIETVEPGTEETSPIPRVINIRYDDYIPPGDDHKGAALFTLFSSDGITTRLVRLKENPFPDMLAFELPPEAVTIIPGSFDCHHLRLVSPKPQASVAKQNQYQVTTIRDVKIDYWISNVKDSTVAVKKTITEREQIIKTSLDGMGEVPEKIDRLIIRKWTLADFNPMGG